MSSKATAKKSATTMTSVTQPFSAEISKVLKLVIHSLYTNRDIFLRELISNASDACEKLRYLALTKPELMKDDSELKIRIRADLKAGTLSIRDNGIGMNAEDMVNNLGTIAKSGTEQFLAQLSGDNKRDASLIGQFGVGFYSAFMAADKVEVTSRKAGEKQGWHWESAGEGEFSIQPAEGELPRGTTITLHLREDAKQYLDKFKLMHIIETYSDHIGFPIDYADEEHPEAEVVNAGSAIWTRNKSDITEEQYREFYRHVGHSPDEPFLTLHNKVEGVMSYTNLLFVPSMRPFDLFHPDRKRRVKLYVKRVFITDENVDLIPRYLRFLKGIVDSEDLPLNISRETLQDNPMLAKVRDSITKKMLGELKKKAEKEPESYAKFWGNFGSALKEGLCEATLEKDQIFEACRFTSTHGNGDQLTSLDAYINRMKDGQEHIYYINGDRLETLAKSPQLEGFRKKGVEVLLLTDHVDDFWVNVATSYKGKHFKSVLQAGEELAKLGGKPDSKEEAKKDEPEVIKTLLTALKGFYDKEEVKDVRTTEKLSESPVCLAVEEGMMSIRMERFLVEHKQLPGSSARILEINPQHPVIQRLAASVSKDGKLEDEAQDMASLLLDQARILEGEEVRDPSAFSRRINALISKGFVS